MDDGFRSKRDLSGDQRGNGCVASLHLNQSPEQPVFDCSQWASYVSSANFLSQDVLHVIGRPRKQRTADGWRCGHCLQ